MKARQGYLHYRRGHPVGYGYLAVRSGPFVLLDAEDSPAVLARAENASAEQGHTPRSLAAGKAENRALDP
jgi:hypothetical protein